MHVFQTWIPNTIVQGFGAQAWPWRETVYHEDCIYTAFCTVIALYSMYLYQTHYIVFLAHPPLPIYTTISLQVYIEQTWKSS